MHAPSPVRRLSRAGSRGRMVGRAAPPADPGLRAFLQELGRMAADRVLERFRNGLKTKDFKATSIKSPRGTHRDAGADRTGAARSQKESGWTNV